MIRVRPVRAALLALLTPTALLAHAVVYPDLAPPGAYQKYVLRVPTERDLPTTRIEIRFPEAITVVSFADVSGWQLETRMDEAGRIVGATWTGTLPPQRFVELPFVAVNPREETTLTWPVVQTYAGGEVVEWSGPEGSDTPASITRIAEGTGEFTAAGWSTWAAGAALLLALLALGLALRPRRSG